MPVTDGFVLTGRTGLKRASTGSDVNRERRADSSSLSAIKHWSWSRAAERQLFNLGSDACAAAGVPNEMLPIVSGFMMVSRAV
jgi:hypothetical protein